MTRVSGRTEGYGKYTINESLQIEVGSGDGTLGLTVQVGTWILVVNLQIPLRVSILGALS